MSGDSDSDSESATWGTISKGQTVFIDENTRTFKLRTVGQGHFDIHFGENTDYTVGFECDLNLQDTDYTFLLHTGRCSGEFSYQNGCCQATDVPSSHVRKWTFTTNRAGLKVKVNGVKVMHMKLADLDLDCMQPDTWIEWTQMFHLSGDDTVTTEFLVLG